MPEIKSYMLNNGKIYTIRELEIATGLDRQRLYYRMRTTMDLSELSRPAGYRKGDDQRVSTYDEIYKELSPKQLKLLFGKW
tara:strand:+ start:261 stop:503 length:243 start_codon:yes stop_codon:yes gene_type:complete